VRLFRRADRDQLTQLVNAHAEAVVPGMSVSVNTVLSSLERQPGEFIVDPWVSERVTLVAEQRNRVAAAAHLLRYHPDDRARESACADIFGRWGVTRQHADGELPVPGVYGVPEQWPHIAALYRRAGFTHTGHTEVVYLAQVKDLPAPFDPVEGSGPPLAGLAVRRSVGINGCRFSALLGEEVIGYIETEILDGGERMSRHGGWADVGNLHVAFPYGRCGVGSWLLGQAADWLRLAGVSRLLNYAWLEGTDPGGLNCDDYRAFLPAVGFRELTRTARGWTRP
jgi:GNAT superfamily N-acetyltransferase